MYISVDLILSMYIILKIMSKLHVLVSGDMHISDTEESRIFISSMIEAAERLRPDVIVIL